LYFGGGNGGEAAADFGFIAVAETVGFQHTD
jgi:hypothetical protein